MVIRDDNGWRGANGRYFSTATEAHESMSHVSEKRELRRRLQEIEKFQNRGWVDPNTLSDKNQKKTDTRTGSSEKFRYDVALSFAGEQRDYVGKVAEVLVERGIRVFYDAFEEETLWGKNLYDHLTEIYRNKSLFVIIFASKEYAEKVWTSHERQAAQAKAILETREYILPARFDDTEIPGLLPTTAYISVTGMKSKEFANLVIRKILAYKADTRDA